MKRFILFFMLLAITMVGFAQEVEPSKSFLESLDWDVILNTALGIVAFVFLGGFLFAQKKLRQAGELLIKFADAVEDKRIDANEKKDLAESARDLFSKQ